MPLKPEEKARRRIDQLLKQAGWLVQDPVEMNLHAGRGVAVREFKMASGHGKVDYLLFVDAKAATEVPPASQTWSPDAPILRAVALRVEGGGSRGGRALEL